MILHHIQASPNQSNALKTCLRYAHQQDCILLAGDCVSALLQRQWSMALSPFKLVLLRDDVIARGLSEHLKNYEQISYEEFVGMTLIHKKVISW